MEWVNLFSASHFGTKAFSVMRYPFYTFYLLKLYHPSAHQCLLQVPQFPTKLN
jgi:hypothetical protein